MIPHRPAHRRQPAHVYRLRRAIAATVAVLVAFMFLRLTGLAGGGGGSDETTDTTASTEATTTTVPDPPACTVGGIVSADNPATGWDRIIVDTERAIPDWYAPPDLTNISEAGFPFTDGLAVRGLVIDDLGQLRAAADANGTPISIIAAYRSFTQQQDLYERRVGEMGAAQASGRVARPGHSEHQLGTTIDVTTEGATDVDQAWGASPTGQWVASHAHEFGFLISYPSGAEELTCYDFEPWHLRYVGRELAAEVIGSGLTLRHHLYAYAPPSTSNVTATSAETTTTQPAG